MVSIAWDQFTPAAAVLGGLLIGLAVAIYVLGTARIAGITSILALSVMGVLRREPWRDHAHQWAFMAGLVSAPLAWYLVTKSLPASEAVAGRGLMIVAGLLVGVGVRMGNGCTSGHGVCGLSRGSRRSFVNVMVFMSTGILTVWLLRGVT